MGGGLGLGPPYVKEMVQMMNGEISVKSEENKGVEFTVSIPMQTPRV